MTAPLPHESLRAILRQAYEPCGKFGICPQAKWDPSTGQVPRGYLGATGTLEDVKAIFVFAEPGSPLPTDDYSTCVTSEDFLEKTVSQTLWHFENPTHQIHSNIRWIINQIWPQLSFREQLKHVWITEGRLCSIDNVIGNVPDTFCQSIYLKQQFALLPEATIIPFGGKARQRCSRVTSKFVPGIYSVSPPGANHTPARPSWETAIWNIQARL